MDMEHEIPKTLGVLAADGDEEPPKTLDAHYVTEIIVTSQILNLVRANEHQMTTVS